ncbi:MAG: hypothetical protein ACKOXB_05605 [Flavobacteriales bacterium]
MKKIYSILFVAVAFFFATGCSSEASKNLDEDVVTYSFQHAPADCDCKGWVRVGADPSKISCEDECYQILPVSDSAALTIEVPEGAVVDFTGNFYVEKQPFGEEGEPVRTMIYTSYKIISAASEKQEETTSSSSAIPFEKIDTNNFFRSFVAYVQNGNYNDMLFFYDSAYVARHCIGALENDTARCMNEQYCGEVLKGLEKSETRACVDFTEIEKIEFLRTAYEGDDRMAYFKVSSYDGRVIEVGWKFTVQVKIKKPVFGFIGVE